MRSITQVIKDFEKSSDTFSMPVTPSIGVVVEPPFAATLRQGNGPHPTER
jgi:hypothetical protein